MIFLSSHVTGKKHQKHVCTVFYGLGKFKYHVKCKKNELFSKKVEFLGHIASAANIAIVLTKVDAIKQWPQPTCIKDIEALLRLANYYQRFVKGFA